MIGRALLAFAVAAAAASAAAARPVEIDGGRVEGITLASGVKAWLGVPFAAPPLRELRWKPPQPVAAWKGVLHTDRFAPECLQPLRGSRQNHYFGNEATSEDCLYLNIWAPPRAAGKRPVIVWIYGGGFNIGSASMANYSGEGLALDGTVRVNIAYRVGPLGFLAHPELSAESGGGSGNYGLMDQVAALQWVKRNIARFGGDPDNVTIVGQSAGSMSVALLQQSPRAEGLFHRVVGMSGSPFGGMLGPAPLAKAEAQGLALQKELGAASLAELRTLPGDRVTAAITPRDPIVLDGTWVTGPAEQVFARKAQADVPILIGYTRDESFRPLGPVTSSAALTNAVQSRFGPASTAILRAYSGAAPARAAADIARDATVGVQMSAWAAAQHRYGRARAYGYLFTRRHPYAAGVTFSDHDPAAVGAYHTGDVPYWLRTRHSLDLFRRTRDWEAGDIALEREMASALVSFARNGVPTSPSIGEWPAFRPEAPQLVELGIESGVRDWPHFADMALFAGTENPRPANARPRD